MDGEMEEGRAEEREGLKEGGEPCCISSDAGVTEFIIAGWRLSVGEEERDDGVGTGEQSNQRG